MYALCFRNQPSPLPQSKDYKQRNNRLVIKQEKVVPVVWINLVD